MRSVVRFGFQKENTNGNVACDFGILGREGKMVNCASGPSGRRTLGNNLGKGNNLWLFTDMQRE